MCFVFGLVCFDFMAQPTRKMRQNKEQQKAWKLENRWAEGNRPSRPRKTD